MSETVEFSADRLKAKNVHCFKAAERMCLSNIKDSQLFDEFLYPDYKINLENLLFLQLQLIRKINYQYRQK